MLSRRFQNLGRSRLLRELHRILALLVVIPFSVILITGMLLQLKTVVPGIQPEQRRGTGSVPRVDFTRVLALSRSIPEAKVNEWGDIRVVDVRPSLGVIRVRTRNDYEIQIDAGLGRVMNVGPRRVGFLISLHEGSWIGKWGKWGVVFPTAIMMGILLASGVGLYFERGRVKKK